MDGEQSNLFNSTSRLAGDAAARTSGSRRARILSFLAERGPAALFEIAAALEVFDHQISGRLTELERDGLIEKTGDRKTKPETGCVAEVWKLAAPTPGPKLELADRLGYPPALKLGDEGIFERGVCSDPDSLPGVPYIRSAAAGGVRLHYRVELIECPGCGRHLKRVSETSRGKTSTVYRCGQSGCQRTWRLLIVQEVGQPELLALVMTHL